MSAIRPTSHLRRCCVARALALYVSALASTAVMRAESPDFERSVAPLIVRHCLECHNATDAKGELNLTRRDRAVAGGASGAALVPGDADASYLIDRIASGEMPPEKNGKPHSLSADEVTLLRNWVTAGAPWPDDRVLDAYERTTDARAGRDWWSLQPVTKPAVPIAPRADEAIAKNATGQNPNGQNPIDAFIAAKLATHQMSPAPPADPRTLIRRLYFDLTGLPPAAEEIDAFVTDHSLAAYEQIVDRLLASPAFGERWARHWLDVVRFAETNGYERDAVKPNAWKYRDWVVDAINTDLPYDRFVLEQLAGDELPDRTESTVTATGFVRLGTWDDEPNDAEEYKYERLEDMVHTTTTAFLGLTVKCARCHDHKFDPILQTDYYRIGAAFWSGPIQGGPLGGPTTEQLGFDVLGWTDVSREIRPLQLLKKGDPHQPVMAVAAGPLSALPASAQDFALPSAEAKTTQQRLQLAQWIVDGRNPLTPRVAVNRIWQHHFGEGLVRSPDNFGFLGQRPTHPELLDWLASELVEGGWRLKRLHKLMVMSAAYRQASLHPAAAKYETDDAANAYWWHANRQRLDAEQLRDTMLLISGQLDERRGGPSFYPPISDEALEGLSMKGGGYPKSPAEETRRRSLYMFTKRGMIAPLMTTFDACDTMLPNGRRDVTTVAPQALALLNNHWVQEQSQALAVRVMGAASDPQARVDLAWRFALGRLPRPDERDFALAHVAAQRERFSGEKADLLAWSSLCHVLFNANEFIYVD